MHPEIAFRSCDQCRIWQYVEEGQEDEKHKAGDILTAAGYKVRRRGPVPCEYGECHKGHYLSPRTIVPINFKALLHYEQCRATGNFPDDGIVARNARILHEVLQLVEVSQKAKLGQ